MADDALRQAMRTLIEDTLKIVERVLAAQAITNKPGVKITQVPTVDHASRCTPTRMRSAKQARWLGSSTSA